MRGRVDTNAPLPSFETRFNSAHANDAAREATARAQWRKEMDRLQIQMQAMVESIGLLEREVVRTTEKLAQAQHEAEAEGGVGRAASTAADLELLLGQLEDKLMCTEHELEGARRLWYFPTPDGYKLRFSYQDNFLGFKELLVEQLRGTLRFSVTPGIAADGSEQPPKVRLAWEGSGEGIGKEPGGLLRFLGEGVSLYSRREMLGVALSPNITLERMDVSARFAANIPLVYNHSRRAWRLEEDFKIELLKFNTEASAHGQPPAAAGGGQPVQESMVRAVMSGIVEAVTRQLLVRKLGPTLGEYLRRARHGAELVLELDVRGIPVRTLHAPLGEASGGDDARVAAGLLGLSAAQVRQLCEVSASYLPHDKGLRFTTLAELLRYFGSASFLAQPGASADDADADELERRRAMAALWHETLRALPSAAQVAPPQMAALLEHVSRLTRRPASVVLRCRSLRVGLEPRRVLRAVHGAVTADLASRGHIYGSANSLLDSVCDQAAAVIGEVERSLRQASTALRLVLQGGRDGSVALTAAHLFYRGQFNFSKLLSARNAPAPYVVTSSVGRDGGLQMRLSLKGAAGSMTNLAAGEPQAAPLLEASVRDACAALLMGSHELLRVQLRQLPPNEPPPPPPVLPPLPAQTSGGTTTEPSVVPSHGRGGTEGASGPNGGGTAAATAAATAAPPAPRKRMDVYENQRRQNVFRGFAAEDLLPIERATWSDASGNVAYRSIEQVALPAGDGHVAAWRWAEEPWRVDLDWGGRSDDGWQYAVNWGTGWLANPNPLTTVRRRRWVRTCEQLPTEEGEALSPRAALSPSRAALSPSRAAAAPAADATEPGSKSRNGVASPAAGAPSEAGVTPNGVDHDGQGGGEDEAATAALGGLVSAAALLQVGTAEGVTVRLSAGEATASGMLLPLVDHLLAVLRGESPLGMQPWMTPIAFAVERIRKHLLGEQLRADAALTLRADTEAKGGLTVHLAGPTALFKDSDDETPQQFCFTFRAEVNLFDFVEDVSDLVSALTTKVAAQTPFASLEASGGR